MNAKKSFINYLLRNCQFAKTALLTVYASILLAGCGMPMTPTNSGTCSVNGTLLGTTLAAVSCVAGSSNNMGTYTTDLVIADFGNVCSILASKALKANSNVLDLHFSGNSSLTVGMYQAGTSSLDVQYANYDATCNSPKGESAGVGTVAITQASSTSIVGTFDLTFNSDHVTGSFNAPICGAMAGMGGPSCQ